MNPLLRLHRLRRRPTDRLVDYLGSSTAQRSVERERTAVRRPPSDQGTSTDRFAAVLPPATDRPSDSSPAS